MGSIYSLVACVRRTNREAHELFSFKTIHNLYFFLFFGEALVGHIVDRSFTPDKDLIILHLNGYVISSGQEVLTGLSMQGFWA